jgi:hypothetical protein
MRLAQPHATVNEERIVGTRRRLRDRLAACAISLFGPTTNVSKLLRGFNPSALLGAFTSRGGSGSLSTVTTELLFNSEGFPEGGQNFTSRGAPRTEVMADCKAAM